MKLYIITKLIRSNIILNSSIHFPWWKIAHSIEIYQTLCQLDSSHFLGWKVFLCNEQSKKDAFDICLKVNGYKQFKIQKSITYPKVPSVIISSNASSEYIAIGELNCFCAIFGFPTVVKTFCPRTPFPCSIACTQYGLFP